MEKETFINIFHVNKKLLTWNPCIRIHFKFVSFNPVNSRMSQGALAPVHWCKIKLANSAYAGHRSQDSIDTSDCNSTCRFWFPLLRFKEWNTWLGALKKTGLSYKYSHSEPPKFRCLLSTIAFGNALLSYQMLAVLLMLSIGTLKELCCHRRKA